MAGAEEPEPSSFLLLGTFSGAYAGGRQLDSGLSHTYLGRSFRETSQLDSLEGNRPWREAMCYHFWIGITVTEIQLCKNFQQFFN